MSQNFLSHLPPSIGLCRKLHTLNIDDNDVECLPKEVGSCVSLRILSAHGNRLHTLPAELDHISGLAVINVTANLIQVYFCALFGWFFMPLLHTSTMSQTITNIHGYSQIFRVS